MLELISDSAISKFLRHSLWIYPLVNTGHIIGLGMLIGSIVPLDLRLLGFWRSIPVNMLARVLLPVATSGLIVAMVCGVLLFVTRPGDYATSMLFISKLAFLVIGILNAVWLLATSDWKLALKSNALSARLKLHSIVSLVLWLTVVLCGRLIGYR